MEDNLANEQQIVVEIEGFWAALQRHRARFSTQPASPEPFLPELERRNLFTRPQAMGQLTTHYVEVTAIDHSAGSSAARTCSLESTES